MNIVARSRESLTLILVALLPLHAMAVTVLTHILEGSGSAPLVTVALWKEFFLAFILFLAVLEIFRMRDGRAWSLNALDWCILLSIAVGAYASVHTSDGQSSWFSVSEENVRFLFGFKYDFLPLVAFFLLRRVSWSRSFSQSVLWILIATGAIFSLFGIVALYLPMSFFTALGYSDLHSLYLPHAPIAAFQMVEGTELRRLQSVMSGPNQFGLWLLLPIAASFQSIAESFFLRRRVKMAVALGALALCLVALVYTYSRSAWIGLSCMSLVMILIALRHFVQSVLRRSMVIVGGGLVVGAILLLGFTKYREVFIRPQSMLGHLQKPLQAVALIRENPLGLGLGTAGPVSNRFSDTCVFFDLGADVSWAKNRTDICVFVGGVRRIPAGKVCDCPLLTENWYLQWGVEMGWIGLMLSVALVFLVLRTLPTTHYLLLTFFGISLSALFLHAWEDSAVAYSVWVLLASVLPVPLGRR